MLSHPLAELFPRMSKEEYADLVKDIQFNGLRDPIITVENKILDGRHRFDACKDSGQKPRFMEFSPMVKEFAGMTPFKYVMSKNFYRRSLTPSQKAIILAESAKSISGDSSATLAEIAKAGGVSRATLARAKKVVKKSKKLTKEVRSGKKSVHKAYDEVGAKEKKSSHTFASLLPKATPSAPYKEPEKDTRALGEVARDGYYTSLAESCPPWSEIAQTERDAWTASAEAVRAIK